MAQLSGQRYDEVLQLVNSYVYKAYRKYGSVDRETGEVSLEDPEAFFEKLARDDRLAFNSASGRRIEYLRSLGFDINSANLSGTEYAAIDALYTAVQNGQITRQEADDFLRRRFGRTFSGAFSDASESRIGSEDLSVIPDSDPEAKSESENARAIQEEAGLGTLSGGGEVLTTPLSIQGIQVGSFPEVYSSADVGSVVEQSFDTVTRAISDVANGNIRIRASTIPGQAIIPGTLDATRFDLPTFQRTFQRLPGPDQAIEVTLRHSDSMDRYYTNGGISGPGRVWQVTSFKVPDDWRPFNGMIRYRIIRPGMSFGVFNVDAIEGYYDDATFTNNTDIRLGVQYGIVISGLPWLKDQRPEHIVWCGHSGYGAGYFEHVGVLGGLLAASGDTLFEEEATADFRTNPPSAYSSFGLTGAGTNGVFGPDNETLDMEGHALSRIMKGWTFQVVTGRTSHEVYSQLNTRRIRMLAHVPGDGVGPFGSCPPGVEATGPAPATLYHRSGPNVATATDATVTINQVYSGAPFVYEDCKRLRFRGSRFAMVVKTTPPKPTQPLEAAISDADMYLNLWHQTGIRTVELNNRDLAIDVVVA